MKPFTIWIDPPFQSILADQFNIYGICLMSVYWRQPVGHNTIRVNFPNYKIGLGIMERRGS